MASTALAERLEARITAAQKQLLREAAMLRGISLTDFVVNSAHEAAVRTLEERHVIELGRRDQRLFLDALFEAERPGERLRRAAERHGYLRKRARVRRSSR